MRLTRVGMVAVLAGGLLSCSAAAERVVTLRVLDFLAPEEVVAAGPLRLEMDVQESGCLQFDRFDTSRSPTQVFIAARGRDLSFTGAACSTDTLRVRRPIDVQGPFANPLTVSVTQSDGTRLEKAVSVR